MSGLGPTKLAPFGETLFPKTAARAPKECPATPDTIRTAYAEACDLFGVHAGASGAYARRALELVLEDVGYEASVLAQAIDRAKAERDVDKRLPLRLLLRLDYIKEIGNFALHVRRDGELAIVEIGADEVSACLDTIEELVSFLYEEPALDYKRAVAVNVKLKAAHKREIPLPPRPRFGPSAPATVGEVGEEEPAGDS